MKKAFFCGVDVSKDKIDVCFLTSITSEKAKFETLPNNYELIKVYFDSFKNDEILVVFEATSNYHLALQRALSDLNIRYNITNPYKSSLFLKHLSTMKTDISDSYGLAVYARTFKSEIAPDKYNSEYLEIKSYNSTLNLLQKINTQLKNFKSSQKTLDNKVIDDVIANLIKEIAKLQAMLQKLAFDLVKKAIPETEEIIKENKGFGVDLALNLFPQLHFNRDKSEKQFISFIGLSPRIFQSGSSVHKSQKINKMGNSNIRRILFMTALCAIRFNAKFKLRYERLLANGKKKMTAIVAVMCAIVRYLKSLFPFNPEIKAI
ncbi:transposase [Campylobacter concisus]|uniref:transposase n=1 Tax=Campylobacter concisus TaxID=199 RepID=UPI000928AB92|nr:transposase [Campylobacter concisus]OJJ28613.1 transposase [Campylobacter concisus]